MTGSLKLSIVLVLKVVWCSLALSSTTSLSSSSSRMDQSSKSKRTKVVIAGAGPSGLLLAHVLIRRPGYEIVVIEKRPDPLPRTGGSNTITTTAAASSSLGEPNTTMTMTRSFPIALDGRGLSSLDCIPGLKGTIEGRGVYLSGICLHNNHKYKPRIIQRERPTLSIDRNILTTTLLEELLGTTPVPTTTLSIQFDSVVQDVNVEMGWVVVDKNTQNSETESDVDTTSTDVKSKMAVTKKTLPFDHLVAADGGYSTIRKHLVELGMVQSTEKVIPDDYRTIFLESHSEDGTVSLDRDKLHGWLFPAKKYNGLRIISAPVVVGCVSGAIIFNRGHDPFVGMTSVSDVKDYFERLCPTSLARVISDTEAAELLARPTSTQVSVRCDRLSVHDKVLLLGDAGHAVSASVGQGCNSSLQDVQVFCGMLDRYQDDWSKALSAYTTERLPDAHAVSGLSDYATPRTAWMKAEWMVRIILRKVLPTWLGKFLLRPMPNELLMETSLPYSDILRQTQWWVTRVKKSLDIIRKNEPAAVVVAGGGKYKTTT